jgi:murein DD-endopeptidase MepM/ murein hydrolase activator NlpD
MKSFIVTMFTVYLLITIMDYRTEIKMLMNQLQEQKVLIEDIQKETSRTGGAEVPVSNNMYLCPIHNDDYIGLTSAYGIRTSPFTGMPADHQGVDLYGTWHARIVAIADGIVLDYYPPPDGYYKGHKVYGGMLRVQHNDGSIALYAHLSISYVIEGEHVTAGKVIGRQGRTGIADGEHLHFELVVNGERVNPLKYISLEGASNE